MRAFIIIVLLTSAIFVSAQSRKEKLRHLLDQGDSIEQMVGDIGQKDSILLSENLQLAKNQYAMADLISAQARIIIRQEKRIDSLRNVIIIVDNRVWMLECWQQRQRPEAPPNRQRRKLALDQ